MPAIVNLKALGLNTSPNQLDLPEGSLSEAVNVVIRRDNVVEPRRGYKLYGDALPQSTDRVKQILIYKNRILRHYSDKLQFDDGTGTFTTFSGSFSEAVAGLRLKSLEQNGNYYFTTSDGIKKISASSASQFSSSSEYIIQAGGVKAIDFEAKVDVTLGDSTGFLPTDAAVAYRVLWGIKDANTNLILGSPSSRFELYNTFLPVILQDYIRLLGALDDIDQAGSMVDDGDYVASLKLTTNASADDLKTNLLLLTEKLDEDILYANDTGTGVPLTIGSAAISSGVCTITFSAGTATDYFTSGSKIRLFNFSTATGTINGSQTVASVTPTTITFNTTATGPVTIVLAYIESDEYRSLTQPDVLTVPTTHDQLQSLQDYISDIINRLQDEPNAVIATGLKNTYIDILDVTTTVNAELDIIIPQDVTANHFIQVYRSEIAQATGGLVLTTDITPSDELRLVYEAFPTDAELAAGTMTILDISPDSFRGANLYTNSVSGEGILQANDVPPFAKDINTFKNHAFYANTRTRNRYNSTLLGVQNMIDDYNGGESPSVVITSESDTNIYRFIVGEVEETDITCVGGGSLASSGTASYWFLNSANDTELFYVWYKIGTSTDPAISGRTGIQVDALVGDTATQIAEKTADAIALYNSQFVTDNVGAVVTVSNIDEGYTSDATIETSGFTISVITQGKGERLLRETTTIATVADVAGSLAGDYFTLNTAEDRIRYYFWYRVSGVGADPAIAQKTGVVVDIATNDSAAVVAQKTKDALDELDNKFITSINVSTLTVESYTYGQATDSTAGTSGFTITKVQDGAIEVLLSSVVSPSQAVDLTTRSLLRIINQNEAESVYGYYLSGVEDNPGIFLLESRSLNDDKFYMLGNNDVTGASFTPDLAPTLTITSISTGTPSTMLVTTATPHGFANLDQIVISGTDSSPSIDGLYSITYVSATTFRVNSDVLIAGTKGSIIKASFAETSSNEEKVNRVYYSKQNQPESIPILNYFDVGASDKEILRIFPLRDSLFVFKEDGLYRVSGEISPFSLALFDSSFTLIAPDSLDVTNNMLYGWASEGLSTVSESGAAIVSRQIDDQILRLSSSQFTNFSKLTWGLGYDSDNSYYVFTNKNITDTYATICYRFSTLTNSWTIFDISKSCGKINPSDDKLYLGSTDTNYIEQERKSFSRLDYADREIESTISTTGFNAEEIQLGTISGISIGDVVVQTQTLTTYEYNMLLKKLDIDPGVSDSDYFSTLEAVAGDNLRTQLTLLTQKLDLDPGVADTDYTSNIAQKSGSITAISVSDPTILTTSVAHGLQNNRVVTITGTDSTPNIDGEYLVTVLSPTTFSIDASVTAPGTTGSFVTSDNDFDDIKASYNATISKINLDTGVGYTNYSQIDTETIQEAVIVDINKPTKTIILNKSLEFIAGPIIIFKSFESTVTYSPNTMGDPLGLKHLREATAMFASKAFTNLSLFFATDLLPAFVEVEFDGDGNGAFGLSNNFGENFFGGVSHSAPFRTYIPRNCQRCRYIVVKFSHKVARESYALYGISLTGIIGQSSRAYR